MVMNDFIGIISTLGIFTLGFLIGYAFGKGSKKITEKEIEKGETEDGNVTTI